MDTEDWREDDALASYPAPVLLAASDVRHVALRLVNGEHIGLGSVHGRVEAVALARETAATVESAEQSGAWPEFGDRFVRPGAIVSIDVRRGA